MSAVAERGGAALRLDEKQFNIELDATTVYYILKFSPCWESLV